MWRGFHHVEGRWMADLFISYAREDRPRAEAIAMALKSLGFEVFWDTEIPPGQTWADYIESKLRSSKAMVVLWSAASTGSQWVREEARIGRDSGKLIPVMLDGSPPPFGFGEVQGANLSTWKGEPDHPDWQRFVKALNAATGKTADPDARTGAGAAQSFGGYPPHTQSSVSAGAADSRLASSAQGRTAGAAQSPGARLSPMGYVQKCLAHYADGKGRAGQAEFWWFYLFAIVVYVIAYIVDGVLFGTTYDGTLVLAAASTVVALALLAPTFAVSARRLHDIGLNGWIAIAIIIPLVGIVIGLVPGKPEANEYGPRP
jgi:uncharacterized membrane protein YhaH (DUF805 family)